MCSLKLMSLQLTSTSNEIPERFLKKASSCSWGKVKGTNPARNGKFFSPNFLPICRPKSVEPIRGIEEPPVAITSESHVISASFICREKIPAFSTILWTDVSKVRVTSYCSHSSSSTCRIAFAFWSQNSCPSVFSCHVIWCFSINWIKSHCV